MSNNMRKFKIESTFQGSSFVDAELVEIILDKSKYSFKIKNDIEVPDGSKFGLYVSEIHKDGVYDFVVDDMSESYRYVDGIILLSMTDYDIEELDDGHLLITSNTYATIEEAIEFHNTIKSKSRDNKLKDILKKI